MTIDARDALDRAIERLAEVGIESATHDAEALLAHVVGVPRTVLHRHRILTTGQHTAYLDAISRRERREPLQHILGSAAFRHLELLVGPGVFVPRPETEVLAGAAIEELHRLAAADPRAPRLAVDLCTGSGAVAIAMATEVPGTRVTAVELSADAAAYARRNARGAQVDVREGDIAKLADNADLVGRVNVVTANPPYIPLAAYESVDIEARAFDPAIALWSGEDGLDTIRLVCTVAAALLVDGGLVVCEHADVQAESAPGVFAAAGWWTQVCDHVDLTGRPRFVTARRIPRRRDSRQQGWPTDPARAGTIAP
ncbi:MAG: Peptide chain release factor N(5)-glutamine methyltransferase [uncultured Nocardioidaceae bacterium]|uniref:Release factor glutamine methyltransferase n=1 Tax=uncultured Nocardioidaceae bacterium TaxID=253824 RepID=A0A6J4MY73_9ACTN|nr:MAG: Peptide chain release factor N(5)-glutamine methyltransferase [uncultured Nocardioidaceae bacterium]